MIYLILDTNIWLYMANGFDSISEKIHIGSTKHVELFEQVKEKTASGDFKVLVNEIILNEWRRNNHVAKQHILELEKEKSAKINEIISQNGRLFGDEIKSKLQKINNSYKAKIDFNKQHISNVESFIQGCPIFDISKEIKLEIAELAIKKEKAPFTTSKNNCADAAILFGAIQYLNRQLKPNYEKAVFVSSNYKEYGAAKNSNHFHPDLLERINNISLEYHQHFFSLLEITEDLQYEIDTFHEFMQENFQFICMSEHCESFQVEYNFSYGYLENQIRVSKTKEIVDPNQLFLFPWEEIRNNAPHFFVMQGECNTCSTSHTGCPSCSHILVDLNENGQYFCMNCAQGYETALSLKHNDSIIFPIDLEEFHL